MSKKLIFKNLQIFTNLTSQTRHYFPITNNTPRKLYSTGYVDELVNQPPQISSQQPAKPPKKVNYRVSERGFYDTHAFIKTLVETGEFTTTQAETLSSLFKDITNYVVDDIKTECVTKSGQVIE